MATAGEFAAAVSRNTIAKRRNEDNKFAGKNLTPFDDLICSLQVVVHLRPFKSEFAQAPRKPQKIGLDHLCVQAKENNMEARKTGRVGAIAEWQRSKFDKCPLLLLWS